MPLPTGAPGMIIVPTDAPGFNLVRNVSVMGHVGHGHDSHAEVLYQSCRVPRANLLGQQGAGFKIAQERLGPGRIHHCMRWLGIAARSFELMCQRANERTITPDGDTLAARQVIQHWAAELSTDIRASRLLTLHAAWMIDRHGAMAARDEIAGIKFTVANTMLRTIDTAIQVHGALGVTDDTILAYWYRRERAARHLRRSRRGPQDDARPSHLGLLPDGADRRLTTNVRHGSRHRLLARRRHR